MAAAAAAAAVTVALYVAARHWRGALGWAIARVLLAAAAFDPAERVQLSDAARAAMACVFGGSLDISRVEIRRGVSWPLSMLGRACAICETIFLMRGEALDRATLVHELTHVWQFQNGGHAYITDSVVHQLTTRDAYAARCDARMHFPYGPRIRRL